MSSSSGRPNSFPSDKRLRRSSEYARVFAHGKVWWHPLVSVRVAKNSLDRTRVGFTVSRRLGKAVVRNQVRRRFREIVRQMSFRTNVDIVISARPAIVGRSFDDIREALQATFKRANLLPAEPH